MRKQVYPPERVRRLIAHYDNQTEAEQAAEIEAAVNAKGQVKMSVPAELAPKIVWLIAQHKGRNSSSRRRQGSHKPTKKKRRSLAQKVGGWP